MSKGPVVLVVLSGYPGCQCPYCNRQVQDFIHLGARANEFLTGKKMPDNMELVLDPGYDFTNLYGFRWDAPHETAYPSTFLIDNNGVIFFSKIVKEHGGRTTAAEILDALPKRMPAK